MQLCLRHCARRVSFYGASVTAQRNGYVDKIADLMKSWNVYKHGYGGLSINICKLDLVLENKPDIVFLDWSLHDYCGDANIIRTVVWRIVNISAIPVFIHMPRTDSKPIFKSILDINSFSAEFNISVIDMRNSFSKNELKNSLLRDNCHTTTTGAYRYAIHILNYLRNEPVKIPIYFELLNIKYAFPIIKKTNIDVYNSLNFHLQGEIIGMSYKIGPHSNFVDHFKNDIFFRRIKSWDPYCYYTRTVMGLAIKSPIISAHSLKILNLTISKDDILKNYTLPCPNINHLEILEICYIGLLSNITADSHKVD